VVGNLFSMGRVGLADFFLTMEPSYRGTLLGIRHRYDVVTMFRLAALAEGDAPVVAWADAWLAERLPFATAVAEEIQWFVAHPERALRSAKLARAGAQFRAGMEHVCSPRVGPVAKRPGGELARAELRR
jgi:hypothetical protein